ncbi:MAG: hypothetical protein ACYCTL_09935 [Acidimicrobiales bacterium]
MIPLVSLGLLVLILAGAWLGLFHGGHGRERSKGHWSPPPDVHSRPSTAVAPPSPSGPLRIWVDKGDGERQYLRGRASKGGDD